MVFLMLASALQAQRISYTDIDRDDYRQMNFEIIGKVGGNINIYKNFRNKNDISVKKREKALSYNLRYVPLSLNKAKNIDQ